ncbi:MAG: DNA ligase D, partial [Rhizobiaceae bacterium]|nr:DNA ligase D [Rhizobiaceae bacterium]
MATKADALLSTYREKRDFARTSEPSGTLAGAAGSGLAFVVQKHDATRLHYDFRVEWEGVLKSWAVTRGPSLDPADKRLAVRTEDHPLDYGDFEGTIPKGAYGGGTVMLWDRGTWEPHGDAEAGLAAGNLKMVLHGERMTGRWALIRMKPRAKEKRENWLLIKEKDEIADPDRDILATDCSVKTGRPMAAIAEGDEEWTRATIPPSAKDKARSAPKAEPKSKTRSAKAKTAGASTQPPAFRPLQLATLVSEAPAGPGWLHEMKYDGYRVEIAVGGGRTRLFTRTGLDWTDRFAALLPAVAALRCDSALIDGEVVAFDGDGKTDFSELQKRLKDGGDLACLCFDILALDGTDLAMEPLHKRKVILKALLDGQDGKKGESLLLYSDHVRGNGPAMVEQIRQAGLEGIVSKKADAPYRSGRGKDWLKTKCTRRQEFVIGGFSPSAKKGRAFSSILVGVREGGELRYRGRVGSGFDDDTLRVLKEKFSLMAGKASPFSDLPAAIARTSRFLEPTLVAEVDFAEMTADGHVRHGVFKGLREDKPPADIVDEATGLVEDDVEPKPSKPRNASAAEAAPRRAATASKEVVAGITVTHPERTVFDASTVTKLDLARYYEAVAPRMLAHLSGRPLSLVRCPSGTQRKCFFQK